MDDQMEKAYMRRDTAGNVVDQNRYIKCMSEGMTIMNL